MEGANKCVIGTKIFIRDKNKVWASAEIINEDEDNIIVKTEDDDIIKLKETDEFYLRNLDLFDSSGLSAPSDLTKLTHLHEASILHSLNLRFDIDEIYTFTGPILIAVNPFKIIKDLYSDNMLAKHVQPIKSKSPHIFATSNSAYLGMCNNNKSQTILISGESGAGKTESTKYVMKFLACAGSDIKKRSLIESQVLESNPLLEAFGNARTLRNNNSSRFGKYIELQFSVDHKNYIKGKLCGAKILTYLLEKVRVCDQQEGERNYHIFYQLCKAVKEASIVDNSIMSNNENDDVENYVNYKCDEDKNKDHIENNICEEPTQKKKKWYHFPSTSKFRNLENVEPMKIDFTDFKEHVHFRYLTKSSVYELNEVNELEEFESTVHAMQTIGISNTEQYQIFKILEGILYIGNILFNNDETKEEATILEVSNDDLRKAAYFLDIDENDLINSLCYKTIVANNEHYKKPVNSNVANDIRDALSRAIYGCLFLKVVERTNESIGYIKDINLFCGVLDIFGFESFPVNSFEQLCINYTNECLQQFFNNFIFKCEEKLYMEEGIRWDPLDFPDNKDCVDILESKPYGVFCMLDEECYIPSGRDKSFCSKIISKHTSSSNNNQSNKRFKSIKTDSSSFIIVHFAGQVVYNSTGFLEKNKDQLSLDAQKLLLHSKNTYVSHLFETYLRRNTDKRKFVTVSSEFKEQLNLLMTRIKETEPHFIRCIKPNAQNVPDVFDRISVNEQLKYGGVLQAIKVSRAGYPVRLSHAECVQDYKILLNKEDRHKLEMYNKDNKSWSYKANFILSSLYVTKEIQEYINNLKLLKDKKKEEENKFFGKLSSKKNKKMQDTTTTMNEVSNNVQINNKDETNNNNNNMKDIVYDPVCGDANEEEEKNNLFIWSVGKNLCFFKSDAYNILSTLRSDLRSLKAIVIQKNYKTYTQKKLYELMKRKIIIIQRWFRNRLNIIRKEKLKRQEAEKLICSYIYTYIIRKRFLHKRNCCILIQSHIRRYLMVRFYKTYRQNYYASKIQATWKAYKEHLFYKKLLKSTKKIQLKWKSILARKQLRRLKMESKEVGSLLSRNQVLMKELKKEKNEKIEIESKLLKASAKIDKLIKKIDNLEKDNKNNEKVIKDLLEKVSLLSYKQSNECISPRHVSKKNENIKQKKNNKELNKDIIMSLKREDTEHVDSMEIMSIQGNNTHDDPNNVRNSYSTDTNLTNYLNNNKSNNNKDHNNDHNNNNNDDGDGEDIYMDNNLTFTQEKIGDLKIRNTIRNEKNEEKYNLLNKIKKLEIQNKEYIKQNVTLNDKYNKLVSLLGQIKDTNNNVYNDVLINNINNYHSNGMSNKLLLNNYNNYHNNNNNNNNNFFKNLTNLSSCNSNSLIEPKIENNINYDNKSSFKKNDGIVDILVCGPRNVGKTSLLEDLFVRLGDEDNLGLLRKNKKLVNNDLSCYNYYNTYIITHKCSQIKIVDCGYSSNKNVEESLFNYIKNSICIIVVFDATNKESINPAVHLLQEASLINVKKTTKLYLFENIFNEKINLNFNKNDVSYAVRVSKACNASYVKALDIYDIVNNYANKITLHSNYFLDNTHNNCNYNNNYNYNYNHVTSVPPNQHSEHNNNNYYHNNKEKDNDKDKDKDIYVKGLAHLNHMNKSKRNTHSYMSSYHEESLKDSDDAALSSFGNKSNDLIKSKRGDIGKNKYNNNNKNNNSSNNNNNNIYSVVNTLKAICGIQNSNKKNQQIQLLRESMPLNNYIYGNKKYNSDLGKGLQPVYEITLKGNIPITYLCMGQDNINKNYTLLSVGCKDGVIYIYKCFRTSLELKNDYFYYYNDDSSMYNMNNNMDKNVNNVYNNMDKNMNSNTTLNIQNNDNNNNNNNNNNVGCDDNVKKSSSILSLKNDSNKTYDESSTCTKLLSKLSGHKKAITCLVFSFSEDKIISSSIDRTIKIWEVSSGFLLKVFSDSSATLSVLLFPTNLDIFLCSNCTSLLRIVNLNSGQVYQKIKVESEIRALEMDDTCLNIFAGSKNGTIYVLEVIYNERVEIKFRFLFSLSPITCIKFIPRHSVKTSPAIIVNSCDNHIGIIECVYGNKGILTTLYVKHRIRINHALLPIRNCYSRFGGGWVMSGSEDGNIYICSLLPQSNYKLIFLKHHKAPVMAVVVNNIDTLMVSGDSKGNIVFWRRSFV
ncbi:hypothetical protein PFMC_04516 [Plasmodium falciparum CAMP/Malaysia]|uniref:Myosin C n=1 Tax=Plasmodium falciparum (isolate Camp / Malaysia) TaxID=5835 RepID=A0A024X2D2_PLAFC|nr:hypothetical protein PFMC_04516 [Plasmodium falciparum CAMP/Malaysia]